MKQAKINIYEVPHIIGLGDHVSGRGHFMTFPKGRNIRAHYIKGFLISAIAQSITADVVEVELDTDVLKPLIDYFEPGTQICTVETKAIKEYGNTSTGPRFSHFYALQSEGQAGDILFRNALAIHILQLYGVWILDEDGEIIQPVTASVEYGATPEKYTVSVIPIDGLEPFQFSADGLTYGPENVLEYDRLPVGENGGRRAFIKDFAGTVGVVNLDSDKWYLLDQSEPE